MIFRQSLQGMSFKVDSIPLSLYIHYPFCVRKCPYCDFYSRVKPGDASLDERYVTRLITDLKSYEDLLEGRQFGTVFMGGGTPSLISPKALERLFGALAPHIASDAEITLEVNPGTLTGNFAAVLEHIGVNRISIGVQSFNDKFLKALGRIHTAEQALETIKILAGKFRLNIDMMHALPGQSINEALSDLKKAADLGLEHLSWYELTLEEGTYFYENMPLGIMSADDKADLDEKGFELLKASGFCHYEVSAFTRDKPCYHNLNYWHFGDYLGLGAGAHGKITSSFGIIRTANQDDLKVYFDSSCHKTFLDFNKDKEEIIFEYMLNRLRLKEPVTFDRMRVFLPYESSDRALVEPLLKAEKMGLVAFNKEGFKVTLRGQALLNELLLLFLKE